MTAIHQTTEFDELFRRAGKETGIDWLFLKAQALAESNLNPRVVSQAGAMGIAQFMPDTWREWGKDGDPFDPADAIPAQARYLRWLLKRLDNNPETAWASYNWGIGHVEQHISRYGRLVKSNLPKETQNYLDNIGKNLKLLRPENPPPQVTQGETHMSNTLSIPTAEPKSIAESKTVWINAIAALIVLGLNLAGVAIPGEIVLTTIAGAVVNIGLRLVTKQPVALAK